jgi:hypothetical protein
LASAELTFFNMPARAEDERFGSGLRAHFVMREIVAPVIVRRYGLGGPGRIPCLLPHELPNGAKASVAPHLNARVTRR